jgi:shikimate kinase
MLINNNITLIGMPGAGKSTVGNLLSKLMDLGFIDTDSLICQAHQRTLQNIVNEDGHMKLRQYEEQVMLELSVEQTVISTGGSAVYSPAAMQHLSTISKIIYLSASYEVIAERIKDLDTRGLVKQPRQCLHDLYVERTTLYEKYAEITVDATLPSEVVAERIRAALTEL